MALFASDLALDVATRTHAGWVRSRNDDALFADAEAGLMVLADAPDGACEGPAPSSLAVEEVVRRLRTRFARTSPSAQLASGKLAVHEALEDAFRAGNEAAMSFGDRSPREGAGPVSALAAVVYGNRVAVGSAGDTRAYRLRDGDLRQITRDHTVLREHWDLLGSWDEEDGPTRDASPLTRALGDGGKVEPDIVDTDIRDGDLLVFCTDGLTGQVAPARIGAVAEAAGAAPESMSSSLVQQALDCGGVDNVSVIVARVRAKPAARRLGGALFGLFA